MLFLSLYYSPFSLISQLRLLPNKSLRTLKTITHQPRLPIEAIQQMQQSRVPQTNFFVFFLSENFAHKICNVLRSKHAVPDIANLNLKEISQCAIILSEKKRKIQKRKKIISAEITLYILKNIKKFLTFCIAPYVTVQ